MSENNSENSAKSNSDFAQKSQKSPISAKIRTRFAPSPTGYIHVGNVRTALFAFLVARKFGGDFILRIEDTDEKRFVADAENLILETLTKLGLDWDEGPLLNGGEKGEFAPYHQSARGKIYEKFARDLIKKGRAYVDLRDSAEIEKLRGKNQNPQNNSEKSDKNPPKNQFRFRDNRPEKIDDFAEDFENGDENSQKNAREFFENMSENWRVGQTLRFLAHPQNYAWHDEIMGNLRAGADAVDDFILIKNTGLPTYNFAHIIDDLTMKITHVIRGQEFISSMPNYLNLYDALEISRPIFAHAPHILASSGNKKLGKRDGAKSVTEYFADGYIREALVNFIASMGWNDGTEQEFFSLAELIEKFDLARVQKSGARFDEKRLIWLNGQWIRKLGLEDLYARTLGISENSFENSAKNSEKNSAKNLAKFEKNSAKNGENSINFWGENARKSDDNFRKKVLKIVQERLKTLRDLPLLTEYFFARPKVNWQMILENKQLGKISRENLVNLLKIARTEFEKLSEKDFENLEKTQEILNFLREKTGEKPAILFGIIRFALTFAPFSPGLPETFAVLGRDETLARISAAIDEK